MSNHYSQRSKERLETCDFRLVVVFRDALKLIDHSILCGHRGRESQTKMYELGRSKLPWPYGKHNSSPARAVDAAPYPYDPTDIERICLFAGIVIGVAAKMGIKIRWGGDWDRDTEIKDTKFRDLFHYELVD